MKPSASGSGANIAGKREVTKMTEITMSNKKEKFNNLLNQLNDAMASIVEAETSLCGARGIERVMGSGFASSITSLAKRLSSVYDDVEALTDGMREDCPELCDDK